MGTRKALGIGLWFGLLVATVAGRAEAQEASLGTPAAEPLPQTLRVDMSAERVIDEPVTKKQVRSFSKKPFFFGPRFGYGTTTGLAGVVAEYSVVDRLALGAGIGANGAGLEYEAHARFRALTWITPSGRLHAFTFEPAFSRSRYDSFTDMSLGLCEGDPADPHDNCYNPRHAAKWASWAALEAGWETRSKSGFSVGLAMGFAFLLGDPPGCVIKGSAVPCGYGDSAATTLPTFSATLGQAF